MNKPQWSQPDLAADQFLYQRKGPWPQPSPSYPMEHAPEILYIPPVETLLWNQAIGSRYFKTLTFYPGGAAANAVAGSQLPIPTDAEFVRMMTNSVHARCLKNVKGNTWVSSFTAMYKIADATMPGTFAAPVNCVFTRDANQFSCSYIEVHNNPSTPLNVRPSDPAWNLAKAYALQGASYIGLFVVHPALHFPMDTVNAITKTAVPHTHPLFQLLSPHNSYALAVNNAVLETEDGVLSINPPGTWFDPLTATGLVIKRMFGAGYAGLPEYPDLYPRYDYMKPWMDSSIDYGRCLALYFQPFLDFCTTVADEILSASPSDTSDTYVERWANYISANLHGFPDGVEIFKPAESGRPITPQAPGPAGTNMAAWKFLRLRIPPPEKLSDGADVKLECDVCDPDDLYRAEMAEEMFFKSATLPPNLVDTTYAFTSPHLLQAQLKFHADLKLVSAKVASIMPNFMPLVAENPSDPAQYSRTISASIQY